MELGKKELPKEFEVRFQEEDIEGKSSLLIMDNTKVMLIKKNDHGSLGS